MCQENYTRDQDYFLFPKSFNTSASVIALFTRILSSVSNCSGESLSMLVFPGATCFLRHRLIHLRLSADSRGEPRIFRITISAAGLDRILIRFFTVYSDHTTHRGTKRSHDCRKKPYSLLSDEISFTNSSSGIGFEK